jgi:sugar transferase (PEP-CTERM system associated)
VLGALELIVLFSALYVGAFVTYGSFDVGAQAVGSLSLRALVVTVVMLTSLVSMGLYHFHQRLYFHEVAVRLFVGFVLGSLALAVVFYALPVVNVAPSLAAVAFGYALIILLVMRYFFVKRVDENVFRRRTLVFGAGERAAAIADLRRKADRRGFKIIGAVPAPGDSHVQEANGVLIKDKPLSWLCDELDIDEVVIAMDDRRGNLPVRDLLSCKLRGIKVIDLLEFLERETGKIRIDLVNPGWLIFSPGFRSSRYRRIIKRGVDLAFSCVLLLVAWPVMVVVAVAIKIEDGIRAPIFYKQNRVGFRGRVFDVLKFRSMIENAEADGQAVWAEANDSRVTRVGSVLRKYRLDELPQAFNVLSGQMSIVGPRPERPRFVDELSESILYYSERHTVLPGVTGWAQLRYSYGSTEEDAVEKLQYDLYYVKNQNLLLDLMIILQTVEVILWGKGAR